MTPEDILHASYSRNLSRETAKKTLLKFAKDRGLKDVEIWPHENGWAMRFTNNQGEPRQVVLGNVFGKARGTILSLSGNSVASQIAQLTKKYPGVDFSAAANGGIKVRSNTQSFVAKDINDVIKRMKATKPTKALSASNSVASQIAQLTEKYPGVDFSAAANGGIKVRSNTQSFVAKDINDVIKRMKATKPTKALSASNSVASQIAQLTKKYPKVDFSATNDGQIKVRSNTQSFVAKDINDVIKRMKAKS